MSKSTAQQAAMTPSIDGQELLSQLRDGWAPLPTKTLFALAMGGLRVRMMRSVVTMLSIVFAIAFLTYTGLTNQLTLNVATAARDLETFKPIDPQSIDAATASMLGADLFSDMSQDRQLALAGSLGMGEVAVQAAELPKVEQELRLETAAYQGATDELAKLEASAQPGRARLNAARAKKLQLQTKLQTLTERQQTLSREVALGGWVQSGGEAKDPQLPALLNEALRTRYAELMTQMRSPSQLTDEELEQVDVLLELAVAAGHNQSAQVIGNALEQDRTKRDAASLRNVLRRAGVSIDRTLAGNPMDTWLITMAMLTCAVGIANAMLMSVTERFREIGTMKCLGAQDSLVVKLFLLESAFLGMVGAAIGIVLGIFVALAGGLLQFGLFGIEYFPRLEATKVIVLSVLGGVILAVVGAVYPAFAASRMKPVDALRVDE